MPSDPTHPAGPAVILPAESTSILTGATEGGPIPAVATESAATRATPLDTVEQPTPGPSRPHNLEPEPVQAEMLSALELFHYANRFRDKTFVIALPAAEDLGELLLDLRVLQSAEISTVVLCLESPAVQDEIARWHRHGFQINYLSLGTQPRFQRRTVSQLLRHSTSGSSTILGISQSCSLEPLFEDWPDDLIPLVSGDSSLSLVDRAALGVSALIEAAKTILLSELRGLTVDGILQSHVTPQLFRRYVESGATLNMAVSRVEAIQQLSKVLELEIVILANRAGSLFEEVFTHRGKGTLFSAEYQQTIRQALVTDVMDITLLVKPHVESGALVEVTESDIAADIDSYYVYTINGVLVGCARFTEFGEEAEIGKLCTLPRYQGRGRARRLVLEMVQLARSSRKSAVFSLSIEPKMWEFFLLLGFTEVPRESLPKEWQTYYDFSRPSKAFRLELNARSEGA